MDFWQAIVTAAIGSAFGGVVGGLVGALIGWQALVRSDARAHQDREDDRRLRVEERFDIALSEIVGEIMRVGQAQADFITWTAERHQINAKPSPAHLFALIQSAMFTADPPERAVLDRLRHAFRLIELLPTREGVMAAVTDLSLALTQWRLGEATEANAFALFDHMIAESRMLDAKNAAEAEKYKKAPDGSGS